MNINETLKNEMKIIKTPYHKHVSAQNHHQTTIVASSYITSDTL